MRARTTTKAYSGWRQTQEWLGEWLLSRERGEAALPGGAAIRRALGLATRAKEREVVARLRALAVEALPRGRDADALFKRIERVRSLLGGGAGEDGEAEASFLCAFCGQPTPIEADPEDGETQTFTEDCSVCCRPNVVRVAFAPNGAPRSIEAMAEQE